MSQCEWVQGLMRATGSESGRVHVCEGSMLVALHVMRAGAQVVTAVREADRVSKVSGSACDEIRVLRS